MKIKLSSFYTELKKPYLCTVELTQQQKELIERFGLVLEGMGLTPAAARINALLTVSDSIELTFDDIKNTLGYSKSATSNALNALLQTHRINYKTKHGDRKRYFYSNLDQWERYFRANILALEHYQKVLQDIVNHRSSKTETFNHKLEDFTHFISYFINESVQLIDDWEHKKSTNHTANNQIKKKQNE